MAPPCSISAGGGGLYLGGKNPWGTLYLGCSNCENCVKLLKIELKLRKLSKVVEIVLRLREIRQKCGYQFPRERSTPSPGEEGS